MIIFNLTSQAKTRIATAIRTIDGDEPLLSGAIGRRAKTDAPIILAGVIDVWPADSDGIHRVALSDAAGAVVWRAFAVTEITAGRGRLKAVDEYTALFGIRHPEPAYEYVCAQMKGRGIRPCSDVDHDDWAEATRWVVADGGTRDPRRSWAKSAWRGRAVAHEAYAQAGLTLPMLGTWDPRPSILFVTPSLEPVRPSMSLEDDAALADLA